MEREWSGEKEGLGVAEEPCRPESAGIDFASSR
jgi:hypothetical protein